MNTPLDFKKGGFYFELYQRIFKLHMKHAGAETDADWAALVEDIKPPMCTFERKLVTEIVLEIERIYKGGGIDEQCE